MKAILLTHLRAALVATLLLSLLCCGIYPLAIWAVTQCAFPHQANGSLVRAADGTIQGSELLGQNFAAAKYFHPRPSSAGDGYDATASGGSNLGPTSRQLHDAIQRRAAAYRAENHLAATAAIPADALTASGSGLDPHISPRNAALQIERVAQARRLPAATVRTRVENATTGRDLGTLGEPGVNVLQLNLSLDALR